MLPVCPVIPTAVGDNGASARDRAAWFVVFYLTSMSELYRSVLADQGYPAEVEAILAANPPRTAPVIPRSAEELLEELTIFGQADAARAQLARWYEAGASMPVLLLPADLTADEIDRTMRAFQTPGKRRRTNPWPTEWRVSALGSVPDPAPAAGAARSPDTANPPVRTAGKSTARASGGLTMSAQAGPFENQSASSVDTLPAAIAGRRDEVVPRSARAVGSESCQNRPMHVMDSSALDGEARDMASATSGRSPAPDLHGGPGVPHYYFMRSIGELKG
jgi:hypothetical protein